VSNDPNIAVFFQRVVASHRFLPDPVRRASRSLPYAVFIKYQTYIR
jgi:hypothetical protein